MQSIVMVNPFRCRVWSLHDRLEGEITEETCRTEIESFSKHGQLIPVLGRPVPNDSSYEVELICGARRLFAARHINIPLKVELRELSDHDALIAMDIENRQRVDVSPYERGISYAHWLREGHFKSQDDISRALRISASKVSRLLKVSRLPSVIVNAFRTPLEIREEWALDLVDALEDTGRRGLTIQRARSIADSRARPPARDVYQQLLLAPAKGRKRRVKPHDEVVKSQNGVPLFRIRRQTNTIAVLLPLDRISEPALSEIRKVIADILESIGSERSDTRVRERDRFTLWREKSHRHNGKEPLTAASG